jgi:DNA-binding NtrC family response regulator
MAASSARLVARRRVVVVDDDIHQASALAALLRLEGVAATSEHIAATALARMMVEPPDAVVLNVKMPGVSGTELLAALRVRHPHLPVLLMTGYDAQDPRLAAALATCDVSYLAKPVELPRLFELLAQHLDDRGPPGP